MGYLKKSLKNTCNIMYEKALHNCKSDFVDKDSCFWYHSVWQYLRLLDCVSSPEWHMDFYITSIKDFVNRKKNKNQISILISGCADNSMLYVIVHALSEIVTSYPELEGEIVAIDLCDTPLLICEQWWEEEKKMSTTENSYSKVFQKINFSTVTKDILSYSDGSFDLIVTDAFLTRFPKDTTYSLLEHWKGLLNDYGQIITTVRVHTENSITLNERCNQIDSFVKKVLERYDQYKGVFTISLSQLKYKAYVYAVRMTSYSWGNEEEIEAILKKHFKIISSNTQQTPGEMSPTIYGHYVLEKD